MIGRKVAEPFVTIVDDGTVPNLLGSINVDDEGTPAQRTVLVDKGILTSYLHDRISARHYGVKPTGNGRRESYQHYVQPRMRNTYMLAGPATPEEVIRQAGNGIYVEDVANGAGQDRRGRLRVLRLPGADDRGRQARAPRSRTSTSWATGRRCSPTSSRSPTTWRCPPRHRGLRQGRAGGAGRLRPADLLVKSLTVGGVKA